MAVERQGFVNYWGHHLLRASKPLKHGGERLKQDTALLYKTERRRTEDHEGGNLKLIGIEAGSGEYSRFKPQV